MCVPCACMSVHICTHSLLTAIDLPKRPLQGLTMKVTSAKPVRLSLVHSPATGSGLAFVCWRASIFG